MVSKRQLDPNNFTKTAKLFMGALYERRLQKSELNVLFKLADQPLFGSDIGGGLLPVFSWLADGIHKQIAGYGFNFGYRKDDNSITGYQINLDFSKNSNAEVLLFLAEALEQCIENLPKSESTIGARDVDDLIELFKSEMSIKFTPAITDTDIVKPLQNAVN